MSDSKNSKTPIPMWPVLEYKNFETKKLQQAFENEGTYKENVPVFDGEGGKTGNAEAFLYVQERFNSVSNRKFQWDNLEKFENFEDVLIGTAQHYWVDKVLTHDDVVQALDQDKFANAMRLMMLRFCGGRHSGDALMEYLSSDAAKKQRDKSVAEHVGRFCTLMGYARLLPREVSIAPTENQEKQLLFNSFPYNWKLNFNNSGAQVYDKTINELSEYMEGQKAVADLDSSKKRARTTDLAKQKLSNRKKGNKRGKNPGGFANQCTRHEPPNNNHEWADCVLNPRSKNFRGNSSRGGRGGRGYGGRGGRNNGGGRGYQTNDGAQNSNGGNQNYNYQQGNNQNSNSNNSNDNNPAGSSNQQGESGSREHFLMDSVWGAQNGAFTRPRI